MRESARDSYRWSFAGERRLRGIREPVPLFRARRPGGLSAAGLAAGAHAALLPQAPGRLARGPQVVQRDGVLVGVHALPEALVAVGPQLPSAARRSSGARSSTLSCSR